MVMAHWVEKGVRQVKEKAVVYGCVKPAPSSWWELQLLAPQITDTSPKIRANFRT